MANEKQSEQNPSQQQHSGQTGQGQSGQKSQNPSGDIQKDRQRQTPGR